MDLERWCTCHRRRDRQLRGGRPPLQWRRWLAICVRLLQEVQLWRLLLLRLLRLRVLLRLEWRRQLGSGAQEGCQLLHCGLLGTGVTVAAVVVCLVRRLRYQRCPLAL